LRPAGTRKPSTPLRAAARETAVAKFSRHDGRAAWLDLLREMGVEIPPCGLTAAHFLDHAGGGVEEESSAAGD
jgi:hypothetical protein